MQIKYAGFNPLTGDQIFFDTKQQAIDDFWQRVIQTAKSHFHNTAYMIVEVHEDGSEVWRNEYENVIDKPKTFAEINELIIGSAKLIENPTKVEVLP